MANKIPKINENDEVIGETTIPEAVENHWPRRISRVFVFDEAGNILLQKRSQTVLSYPGIWDQAVGGHVDIGEDYQTAALREMDEEIGITGFELSEIETSFRNHVCFEGIFKASITREEKITIDPHEVAEVRWFSITEFEELAAADPDAFTPGFLIAWETFKHKLLQ